MPRLLALIAIICCSPLAYGQIDVPSKVTLGTPIVAVAIDEVPDGAMIAYDWHSDTKGCTIVPLTDARTAHIWACEGVHTIDLVVAAATDTGIKIVRHKAQITVGDEQPLPPEKTLAELVSPETAKTLAKFHFDWSKQVADGKLKNREIFDSAYNSSRAGMELLDAEEAYQQIDQMLATVEGVSLPLADLLSDIAQEFGGEPEPVPSVQGPRKVLVVYESTNDTPNRKGEFVKLRTGQESKYLKQKGHVLRLLDDDLTDGDDEQAQILKDYQSEIEAAGLPAIVIIDPKTEQTLHSQRMPRNFTAANITELIRQHGGG